MDEKNIYSRTKPFNLISQISLKNRSFDDGGTKFKTNNINNCPVIKCLDLLGCLNDNLLYTRLIDRNYYGVTINAIPHVTEESSSYLL